VWWWWWWWRRGWAIISNLSLRRESVDTSVKLTPSHQEARTSNTRYGCERCEKTQPNTGARVGGRGAELHTTGRKRNGGGRDNLGRGAQCVTGGGGDDDDAIPQRSVPSASVKKNHTDVLSRTLHVPLKQRRGAGPCTLCHRLRCCDDVVDQVKTASVIKCGQSMWLAVWCAS
jgi:hypothetical protein